MAASPLAPDLPPASVTAEILARIRRRAAGHDAEREPIEVVAPFTGRPFATVPGATGDDVRQAARLARAAQPAWAALSFRDRARPLLRFHDLLLRRQAEVLDLIQLETGKARKDAFEEVADTALVARYYAFNAERHLRDRRRRGALPLATRTDVVQQPVGIVGVIAPWNYPLDMALTDGLPALMAGNAILLKPDHQTPLTALWAVDLLYEAGLPDRLFHVLNGHGAGIGPDIIGAVDFLAFTGSTATGRIVARQAGEALIGCSLELGGKNPIIVLDDADLDRAAAGATRACFSMAGQLCVASERILVHQAVADAFTQRLVRRVRALRVEQSLDWDVDMGSLISGEQLDRVQRHLHDAVERGARVLAGGRHRPDIGPFVLEPTLLADVPPHAELADRETFGPVVSLYTFRDDDDAVRAANHSRYGLNASIWSRDTRRARRIARRIQAGTVNINDGYAAAWASVDAPMGGFKDSGIGRRHGREGILRFTASQTIARQRWIDLGPSDRVSARWFARLFTLGLRLIRRLPGLR
jgi:succinate-semialdehyde dehydrogenase / glutarate-semialdehyde dehydrogenase